MAAMMKKQMLASTTTKRSAVVAQAKTVKASKTVDSAFYGPNRGQFLGPFSESPMLRMHLRDLSSCDASLRIHNMLLRLFECKI